LSLAVIVEVKRTDWLGYERRE